MGNRIHKVLGYGFKCHRYGSDPRFNPRFFQDGFDDELRAKLLFFLGHDKMMTEDEKAYSKNWLKGKGWYDKDSKGINPELSLDEFVKVSSYGSEAAGGICPIVFTDPTEKSDWFRYDDSIDYLEAGLEDNCKLLRSNNDAFSPGTLRALYPWISLIDRRTGKSQGDLNYARLGLEPYNINMVPMMPWFVKLIAWGLEIFKNPLTVYRLKPMIYTYWS